MLECVLGLAFAARPRRGITGRAAAKTRRDSGGGYPPGPMGRPLTAAQRIEAAAPETAVLDAVLDAARLGGWLAAHHTDSRRMKGDPGLPDIILAHPRRGVLFIETKTRSGRLRDGQRLWADALAAAGASARTVRPADLGAAARWLASELSRRGLALGAIG